MSVTNDLVLAASNWFKTPAAWTAQLSLSKRLRDFPANQKRLGKKYGIAGDTAFSNSPVRSPGFSLRQGKDLISMMCWHRGFHTTHAFVMTLPPGDGTLLGQRKTEQVSYFSGLQDAGLYVSKVEVMALVTAHGTTAVHLWLLLMNNPAVICAVRPSTLSGFLGTLYGDWERATALVREWMLGKPVHPILARIARRVSTSGSTARLRNVAHSEQPLPMNLLLPGLKAISFAQDAASENYVRQIRTHMVESQYPLLPLPMCESGLTLAVPHCRMPGLPLLPLMPDLFYEFLPEDQASAPANLVNASSLVTGRNYFLVVSDSAERRRINTGVVVECTGLIEQVPVLSHARTAGEKWSFAGEELTSEQLVQSFSILRNQFPVLQDVHMTCIPSLAHREDVPGYRLLLAYPPGAIDHAVRKQNVEFLQQIAALFDQQLCATNSSFGAYRQCGSLGETVVHLMSLSELALSLRPYKLGKNSSSGEFLPDPLTAQLWENVDWSLDLA